MPFQTGDLILNNRYRIEALLGEGAFAAVYRAAHVDLGVQRAVKVLRRDIPGLGSTEYGDYRQRFHLEFQIAARIDHPNVIKVHDFVEEDGALYAVLELAPGGSLADVLKARGALPPLEVVRLLLDAARGLNALHEQDIVHRDVKPSNILVDAQGRAKIADLGLAQVPGNPLSQHSRLGSEARWHPGTPNYRSPEHQEIDSLLPTADVYSLGCVAFELLTGQVWRWARRKATSVRDVCPTVPRWLDAIIMRMLCNTPGFDIADANDPAKRYVDMEGVVAALEAGITEEERHERETAAALAHDLALLQAEAEQQHAVQEAAQRQSAADAARRQQWETEQAAVAAARERERYQAEQVAPAQPTVYAPVQQPAPQRSQSSPPRFGQPHPNESSGKLLSPDSSASPPRSQLTDAVASGGLEIVEELIRRQRFGEAYKHLRELSEGTRHSRNERVTYQEWKNALEGWNWVIHYLLAGEYQEVERRFSRWLKAHKAWQNFESSRPQKIFYDHIDSYYRELSSKVLTPWQERSSNHDPKLWQEMRTILFEVRKLLANNQILADEIDNQIDLHDRLQTAATNKQREDFQKARSEFEKQYAKHMFLSQYREIEATLSTNPGPAPVAITTRVKDSSRRIALTKIGVALAMLSIIGLAFFLMLKTLNLSDPEKPTVTPKPTTSATLPPTQITETEIVQSCREVTEAFTSGAWDKVLQEAETVSRKYGDNLDTQLQSGGSDCANVRAQVEQSGKTLVQSQYDKGQFAEAATTAQRTLEVLNKLGSDGSLYTGDGRAILILQQCAFYRYFKDTRPIEAGAVLEQLHPYLEEPGFNNNFESLCKLGAYPEAISALTPTVPHTTTVSPTPTETPTPTPTASQELCLGITRSGSNHIIYQSANRSSTLLGMAPAEQPVRILDQTRDKDGKLWYRIDYGDASTTHIGWIPAEFVIEVTDCPRLP